MYRFDASRNTYRRVNHFWGGGWSVPSLRDLNGDGRPEFVSPDDRFTALAAYVAVVEPIQLWSYDHGTFNDVTRRYPKLIQKDAASLWRLYLDDRRKRHLRGESRYILAAWAADEYMLGHGTLVDRVLAQALRRGDLAGYVAYPPRSPIAYIRALKHFLRTTGYIRR